MGSLSGIFQRPVLAVSAVAVASFCSDLRDKFGSSTPRNSDFPSEHSVSSHLDSVRFAKSTWVSQISISKLTDLSFVTRIRVPMPKAFVLMPRTCPSCSSFVSSSVLINSYRSAELVKSAQPMVYSSSHHLSSSEALYKWHLPEPNSVYMSGSSDCSSIKSRTVVVLLGWLGAKQKHLKKYADWYIARGFHVITFTFPMSDILSYQVGGKAEQDVELLVHHLGDWLEEENGKNMIFHTFSNTGWLTYGVILEKLLKVDPTLTKRIKGCIVDSAPVAAPDPQVWASGFSAAFLKKQSVATKSFVGMNKPDAEVSAQARLAPEIKPALTEAALLVVLEKLFGVILNQSAVNRRLTDVLSLLDTQQPSCPQLYIYSSADKVIPAVSVESFIEKQRRSGHEVRACNFISTPHVDHFRGDPKLYTSQLTEFLEDCVITSCKHSEI